ncbi:alanyl-tRNA editing protein [Saccharibacillus sp. CPCC 101409]|uniref:alanyl-tRNA editing protein n=1 Tax=Saccharibacillus sp. CPCC 101409 TaxID=3058041 RepID=UPI002671120A|nr:alanyl-tRNA editing protein [Saccharibacillus sp. CPCC 101409]MDO3409409.1 alanyl-tRNA editing protein [Saccharibacillus sp. CPCC 101409]
MTHKLYYDSAYTREWTARISQTAQREDGIYVLLDETAFYPEGGGQPGDTGWIGEARVLDTIGENGDVMHQVDRLPGETGEEVSCEIDWERRFDHMQQHSGQHLLSATALELLEAPTLSFHLGQDHATIDVDRSEWTDIELEKLEYEVNARIFRSLPIASYTVSPEEASRLPLVKAPSVRGDVRIVEIEGIEYNACGGTHVRSTGELGLVKLLRSEKQKGLLRITFKTGFRALREFGEQSKVLNALSSRLSTPKEELPARIDKWAAEDRKRQSELNELQGLLDQHTASELIQQAETSGGPVAKLFGDRMLKDLQQLASSLIGRTKKPVVLASVPERKLLLAHGGESGFSCGSVLKEKLAEFGGKGGGGDKSAQAAFGSEDELLDFYAMLTDRFSGGEERS